MTNSVFEYEMTADDYLTHQLFTASVNTQIKQQRKRGLILWTGAFFVLALVFYFQHNTYLSLYFIIFGVGFIFIYPFYSRWIYKRHYKRFVYKNFKESNLNKIELTLSDKDITISNGKEKGEIGLSEIEKVYEIGTHIFVKIQGGKNLIIPKQKIENKQELIDQLTEAAEQNEVGYIRIPDWKWG